MWTAATLTRRKITDKQRSRKGPATRREASMAPKTTSLRDNPPSASSSSSEESGSGTEASGSTEYETEDDATTKPNGKPAASSTLTSSPKKLQPAAAGSDSDSGDDSDDDSDEPKGKPSNSSGKTPSSLATKQKQTSGSSTESDSESTDDEAAKPIGKLVPSSKTPPSPAPKKKQQPEEDSGSDSETESSEGKAVMDRDQKPVSLSSKSAQQQKAPITSGKREAEKTPDPKSSKRAKREGDDKKLALVLSQDPEKKNPFQRIFTDSDEIEILKGTAEFEERKKVNVVHDANDFYEFIKKRIETKFTKSQLLNKLQSMKKRFPGLVNRVNKGSKTLKPLDHTLYELSNKLWGPGGCLEKTEKELAAENSTPTGKARKSLPKLTKKASLAAAAVEVSNISNIDSKKSVVTSKWYMSENLGVCHKGGVDSEYMREVMDSVDEEEKAELEARWRKNQADMARVVEERSRIAQQLCKLVDKHSSSSY